MMRTRINSTQPQRATTGTVGWRCWLRALLISLLAVSSISCSCSIFAQATTSLSRRTTSFEWRARNSKPIRYPFALVPRGGSVGEPGNNSDKDQQQDESPSEDAGSGEPPIMSSVKTPSIDSNHNITTDEEEQSDGSAETEQHATVKRTAAPKSDPDASTAAEAASAAAPSSPSSNPEEAKAAAALLRAQGKQLHDAGDYAQAATQFAAAADLLSSDGSNSNDSNECYDVDEFATCRLHQALCCLKSRQYGAAVSACTAVLELPQPQVPAAVRARAGLRRAKAQLALNQTAAALEDARRAAFWGDRKAVALYGQLMREHRTGSSSGSSSSNEGFPFFPPNPQQDDENNSSFETAAMHSSQQANNNIINNNAALFESLLSKSKQQSDDSSKGGFSPASLLQGMAAGGTGTAGGGGGGGELAKSVLQKLSSKLDDEGTQQQICGYLQNCNAPMLQTVARMAGLPLAAAQAQKLADLARAITVRRLQRGVKYTKRIVYAVQLIRKLWQVLQKYRHWFLLYAMFLWTKSAVLRPLPVNRRALKRAARRQRGAAAAAAVPTQQQQARAPATAPSAENHHKNNKPAGGPVLLQQHRI